MSTTATPTAPKKNPSFQYRVQLKDGKGIEAGKATYSSREALIAKLSRRPDVETIRYVAEDTSGGVGKKSRPKARSLVAAARQLELCLSVGLDDREAIDAIRSGGELEDLVLSYGLGEVSKDMGQGLAMSEAMAKHPYIFPSIMIETLRAGEKGGFVPKAAAQVADDIEAADDQRAQLKKALTYPIVVLALSSLIFIFMMMYVVPKFGALYDELSGGEAELPALTQLVMAVSDQMAWAVPLLGVVSVFGVIWYRRNMHEDAVRAVVDPLKLKMPVFGELFRKMALTKFCRVLASLDANGVHPTDALEITAGSVGNITMERAILAARAGQLKGESIVEPLSKEPLFPQLLIKFLSIGESTGRTAMALQAVGKLYKRDVDDITNRMESLIQPFFLIMIAGMVGVIALAVYLPYFSMGDIVSPY